MAKANVNVKRSVIQGEVVLTLTPEEAVVLRSILASCCANAATAPKAAGQLFRALDDVPWTTVVTGNIHFTSNSIQHVENLIANWNPKS